MKLEFQNVFWLMDTIYNQCLPPVNTLPSISINLKLHRSDIDN